MVLPSPTISFTIPSIHDDTILECRLYHPTKPLHNGAEGRSEWRKKGAIVAHPYAPLGGCYDDPVVDAVAGEILRRGFVIGTFNFRGAGNSKGRTSWTAKPELSDYISFAGFFIHYLHNLEPPTLISPPSHLRTTSDNALSQTLLPIQSVVSTADEPPAIDKPMSLILGGYSYGSLITSYLPTTEIILARFASVAKGTAEAEIRLRAVRLSRKWNQESQAEAQKEARLDTEISRGRSVLVREVLRNTSQSITVGGDESDPGTRRKSHETSRRSMESIRKSVEISRKRLGSGSRQYSSQTSVPTLANVEKMETVIVPLPQTYYLLVSPLLPPISMFATFFSDIGHVHRKLQNHSAAHKDRRKSSDFNAAERKMVTHTTLAVYGDKDIFTSQRKLRKWVENLGRAASDSKFQFQEIVGAGHFWHEDGVEDQLKGRIKIFVQDIVSGHMW
ncbi:MAG: hypothetical protein M1827_001973 [Pycnora praestabilis]|nr:MAG: hypothetical protein M1827_001973 [Pycnora praestabilis]